MYSEVLGSSATAVCLLHFDRNGALVTTMVSTRRQEVEIPACGQRRWTYTTRVATRATRKNIFLQKILPNPSSIFFTEVQLYRDIFYQKKRKKKKMRWLAVVSTVVMSLALTSADAPCTPEDERWMREFPKDKVNDRDDKGRTALIDAAKEGKVCKVAGLISMKEANRNIQDNNGFTALMEASGSGHLGCVKALMMLKGGVNPHVVDNLGFTALAWAAVKGHVAIVEHLLSRGATLDHAINNGQTPLMLAGFHNQVDMVKALVAKGADVYARTKGGATALILATGKGHADVVRVLLDHGKDVANEQTTKSGYTALMIAARSGLEDIVRMLLASGADVHPVDTERKDALSYACEANQRGVALLLARRGAPLQHYVENHIGSATFHPNICTSAEFYEEAHAKEEEQDL